MKYVVCLHLYILWKFGERESTPRGDTEPSLSFFCFFCPSRYIDRHRKPRRCVYVLNLGGTGIRPPDSFSYRSNFRFRSSFRSRSSSCSTTSGDIFYCSGSRQLNHSSYFVLWLPYSCFRFIFFLFLVWFSVPLCILPSPKLSIISEMRHKNQSWLLALVFLWHCSVLDWFCTLLYFSFCEQTQSKRKSLHC